MESPAAILLSFHCLGLWRSGAASCEALRRATSFQSAIRLARGGLGLGIGSYGIRGPLTKTGAHPTGQPSSNRHNGALLAPGRRDPIENLFEHSVARQRAPGGFDEQMADTTGALAANMAASHRGPRRILAGRQPRIAEQPPFISKAGHVAQLGRSGPCDHLANTRDTPIHLFDLLLGFGLVTQQAAHLDELARGKAPLFGQQRETHVEFRG